MACTKGGPSDMALTTIAFYQIARDGAAGRAPSRDMALATLHLKGDNQ